MTAFNHRTNDAFNRNTDNLKFKQKHATTWESIVREMYTQLDCDWFLAYYFCLRFSRDMGPFQTALRRRLLRRGPTQNWKRQDSKKEHAADHQDLKSLKFISRSDESNSRSTPVGRFGSRSSSCKKTTKQCHWRCDVSTYSTYRDWSTLLLTEEAPTGNICFGFFLGRK